MRRIVTVALVAVLLAGCGPKGKKTGVVTGKITYKGQPVNGAALLLYTASGGDTPVMTVPVDQEGAFRISDVAPGEYKVVVQGTAGAQQAPPASLKNLPPDKAAEAREKLKAMSTPPTIKFPDKYKDPHKTDLKVTVTDKTESKDLELQG
jgi:hypothetical protein